MMTLISMYSIRRMLLHFKIIGLSGLLKEIKAKLSNSIVHHIMDRQDCKFPFQLRLPSTDIETYRQIFINKEYDFIVKTKPKVIVDAGANVGLASIYFANKYPGAKIIAIEPEQSNFYLLKENVVHYSNIIPVQTALWHENGEINIVDSGFGKWAFITEAKKHLQSPSGKNVHTIEAMTVDKIMEDYNLEKIDILKIDIEGAEKEVFSKASSWIEKVDSLIIELHENIKTGCNRSFYCNSNGFDNEWQQGENVYLSRKNCLTKKST